MKTADGEEIDPIPVGARIRHKRTGLLGRIRAHEWNKPGVLSAIPYCTEWDNESEATAQLGILGSIYSLHESVEQVPE